MSQQPVISIASGQWNQLESLGAAALSAEGANTCLPLL